VENQENMHRMLGDYPTSIQKPVHNGSAVPADKVCVTNSAGFVLEYFFNDLVTGQWSEKSSGYPINQSQCSNIGDMLDQTVANDVVDVYIHAYGGITQPAQTAMVYTPGAATVTFTCYGTTLNFWCTLNGE
jgi:hypothetical protein